MTNRVLCLVPLVAWFEDWAFVRKFQVLHPFWVILVEVIGKFCWTSSVRIMELINYNIVNTWSCVDCR